jgi:hypothetical protein
MSEQEQSEMRMILGKILERLDIQSAEMAAMEKRIRDDMKAMENRLTDRIDRVENRLDNKIDAVEARLDAKIDEVETTMTGNFEIVHSKLEHIIRVQDYQSDKLIDHERRISAVEQGKNNL